jgi:membrane associated rhomboid family serine protease
LSTTRRGGAVAGRQVRVRTGGPLRWITALLVAGVIVVLTLVLSRLDVPHVGAVAGVVGGLLLAFGGPWWQQKVLARWAGR